MNLLSAIVSLNSSLKANRFAYNTPTQDNFEPLARMRSEGSCIKRRFFQFACAVRTMHASRHLFNFSFAVNVFLCFLFLKVANLRLRIYIRVHSLLLLLYSTGIEYVGIRNVGLVK